MNSSLPPIIQPVIIDGTTQPGYVATPLVVLDGSEAGSGASGLAIVTSGCTVRGLAIDRFDDSGILLMTPDDSSTLSGNNIIEGNFLGAGPDGTGVVPDGKPPLGNSYGILIVQSVGNTIGGTAPGEGNIIAANRSQGGLLIVGGGSSENLVEGNEIGTTLDGLQALGNSGRVS